MRTALIIFIFFSFSIAANAAMPPYYDSVEDLKAILNSTKVASILRPNFIKSIEHIYWNTYDITAGDTFDGCRVNVDVIETSEEGFAGDPHRTIRTIEINFMKCWSGSDGTLPPVAPSPSPEP